MKPEQKAGIIASLFGGGMGLLSYFLGNEALGFGVPIAAYIALLFGLQKAEGKKMKWAVTNTILSFLLTWILIWILTKNVVITLGQA